MEVTDLDKKRALYHPPLYSGSKPEYPRPMRCIQGSDAHRLVRENANSKYLGVGYRITEILMDDLSFESLAKVLKGLTFL
ncbi:MAG: hypothetical protein M5U34_44085 [Chloroflexi bacterium]|nr:hypothetical protein [Chloroflexota bacterium]